MRTRAVKNGGGGGRSQVVGIVGCISLPFNFNAEGILITSFRDETVTMKSKL